MRDAISVAVALTILVCIVGLLLLPGATAAVVARTNNGGKQFIRVFSAVSLLATAAAICTGSLTVQAAALHHSRQVYRHGFGPDLLDKTCARLC